VNGTWPYISKARLGVTSCGPEGWSRDRGNCGLTALGNDTRVLPCIVALLRGGCRALTVGLDIAASHTNLVAPGLRLVPRSATTCNPNACNITRC